MGSMELPQGRWSMGLSDEMALTFAWRQEGIKGWSVLETTGGGL